ncbi:MAG: hypothetical protein Q8N59_02805 [bacterium]|nr:hypothetical protein [bacterium]
MLQKLELKGRKIQEDQMVKLLEYLTLKNQSLPYDWPDSYDSDDKPYRDEDCLNISRKIIPILFRAGKKPYMLKIMPAGDSVLLSPLHYKGEISWKCHFVCVCDDFAYDPLVARPIPLEEYFKKIFGVPVKIEAVPSETLYKQQQLSTKLYHLLVSRLVLR